MTKLFHGTEPPISRFDRTAAPVMFTVTLAFLVSIGISAELIHQGATPQHIRDVLAVAVVLWPLYWLEACVRLVVRYRRGTLTVRAALGDIACAICPPLRLGAADCATGRFMWIPFLGWQPVSKELYHQVERALSVPMIIVALAILPILVIEVGLPAYVAAYWQLRYLLILSTAVIWMAFVIEFVLLSSLADSKFRYVKEHWLDLVIILLPLIAFLRLTRLARIGRVARYLRTEKLGRLLRTYSMRALRTKLVRAVLLLNLLDRVFRRNPRKRLEALRRELQLKEQEIEELRRRIRELEKQLQERERLEEAVGEGVLD